MRTKMPNGYGDSRCGILAQLDVNCLSCGYQRLFTRLEECGNIGTLIYYWRGDDISFKINLVKVKKKNLTQQIHF